MNDIYTVENPSFTADLYYYKCLLSTKRPQVAEVKNISKVLCYSEVQSNFIFQWYSTTTQENLYLRG